MDYKQQEKRVPYGVLSISGYSDLDRLNSSVKMVHFRKFVSKRLLMDVVKRTPKLKAVSFSKYAISRMRRGDMDILAGLGIEVKISKVLGRPSSLERWLYA